MGVVSLGESGCATRARGTNHAPNPSLWRPCLGQLSNELRFGILSATSPCPVVIDLFLVFGPWLGADLGGGRFRDLAGDDREEDGAENEQEDAAEEE